MQKIFFTFFIPCLLIQICTGQTTFSKRYTNNPLTIWGGAIAADDSFFYINGEGESYIDGFPYTTVFFLKTDLNGNQVLVNQIESQIMYEAWFPGSHGYFEIANDNSLFAAVFYAQWDTLFPDNEEWAGVIVKYNTEGDTLFTKRFKGDGFTGFYDLAIDPVTKDVFAVGATRDTIIFDLFNYTVKIDSSGNTIYETKNGNGFFDEVGYNLNYFKDGAILQSGWIDYNDLTLLETDGTLNKIDASGNTYFSKVIGNPDKDDGGLGTIVSSNKKYIYARQAIDTLINADDDLYPYYISKMDTNGNKIWQTIFNAPQSVDFWNLKQKKNGNIIGIGNKIIGGDGVYDGYICELDTNGNVLWERTYNTDLEYSAYLFDMVETEDGYLVFSGSGVGFVGPIYNFTTWLLKLDSMGCLVPGCDETPIINSPVNEVALFTIYPNPITNSSIVEINIPENFQVIPGEKLGLNVYDISGKLVDSYSNITVHNPNEIIRFNIYKKNLAAGIYSAALSYGGNNLGAIKIVIE